MQRTARGQARASSAQFFPVADRFGDTPLKNPPKKAPTFGGTAPPGASLAYEYKPEETPYAKRLGSCPTQVEGWRLSEPGGAVASKNATRRPHEHDYLLDLGPGRFSPEKLVPVSGGGLATRFPSYTIGGSGPRLAPPPPVGSTDLMYSLPKAIGRQPLAGRANAAHAGFTHKEGRLAAAQRSTLESRVEALEVLKKVSKRKPVSAEERQMLMRDVRNEHEAGRSSSESYMPKSSFDRAGMPGRSASSAFGGSVNAKSRFEIGRADLERSTTAPSLKDPKPRHGGFSGVAFRAQPPNSPGPGDYATDHGYDVKQGGFDGTGRLKLSHSRSMPSFSMTGKSSMDRVLKMQNSDNDPTPTSYFQTPDSRVKSVAG